MKSFIAIVGCAVGIVIATACSVDNKQPGSDHPPQDAQRDAQRGKQVYMQYCATCHMATGMGMQGVYPPLAGAEFLADKEKTIHAVVNGLQGEIVVKGETYNSVMPPVPGSFSDADIAEVLNYVVRTFGDSSWTATAQDVAAVRKR